MIKERTGNDWKGYWNLLVVQALNAFNEKGTQFLLIPLGVALWGDETQIEYFLSALILLPYLFLSPLVGWVSDCYIRAKVIRWMIFIQVAVMAGVFLSIYFENIHAAIACFGVFTIQAAFFSPAKKGIIKDMLGSKNIGFASGLIEMMVVLALLFGQIGVFAWFDYLLKSGASPWVAAYVPMGWMLVIAVPMAFLSKMIPEYAVVEKRPFQAKLLWELKGQIQELWRDPRLRYSELGISYFWFFGGAMLLVVLQIAREVTGGGAGYGSLGAHLMGWLSGGIVVGGVIASLCSKGKIHMRSAQMGSLIMVASCLSLGILSLESHWFYVTLGLAGAGAAAFLVPLNAYLQNTADNANRSNIIAAGNCIDMFMSLLAVGLQLALKLMGVSPAIQCFVFAGLTIFIYYMTLHKLSGVIKSEHLE